MYCRNCGTKLDSDDLFCQECGTLKKTQDNSIAKPLPKDNAILHYEREKTPPMKKQRKRVHGIRVFSMVSIGLVMVMAISIAIRYLPLGSGPKSGKSMEVESLVVSYAEPSASLAGLNVDVNPLNLTEGDKVLTVEKYKEVIGEDGFLGIEYEITLDDQHYLRAPLTITIPYDEKQTENSEVTILHYEQDYEGWVPLDVEINREKGTVTAKLTSLSPVRLVYFDKVYAGSVYYLENEGQTNATMRVSYNYWDHIKDTPIEAAQIVAQDYVANGNTTSSTDQWIQAGDEAINTVNTYYGLFGAFGDTVLSTVGSLASAGSALGRVTGTASRDIGIVSLMIAGTQLMYDLGTKDSTGPRNETAVNLYKNIAANSGTLYSFCTGYSSAAFTAAFFGVAVTGYVLDTLIAEAKTIQADTVEAIFTTYYKDYSKFNEVDWYNIFVDAYNDAWQNNRGSEEGMTYAIKKVTDAIDAHAEKFWREIYKEGSDALTFAVADAGENNYFTPTDQQKAELTANFKKDLFQRFNEKTIPWINEFMQQKMKEALYGSLLKAVEPYNRYYTVQIQEIAPQDSGDLCQFQQCPIRFATSEGFLSTSMPEQWEMIAPEDDDEWAMSKDFTLMGYITTGAPDKVLFFDASDEKIEFGKQIREEALVLMGEDNDYFTLIDLSGGDINLTGTYELNGKGIKTIKRNMYGVWTDSSRNPYNFDGLEAYVNHRGKEMEITLNNEAETVLRGKYDETSQTFVGRDNKETRDFNGDLFSVEDTSFTFDVSSNPITATGHLDVPQTRLTDVNMTTIIVDFTMSRIDD